MSQDHAARDRRELDLASRLHRLEPPVRMPQDVLRRASASAATARRRRAVTAGITGLGAAALGLGLFLHLPGLPPAASPEARLPAPASSDAPETATPPESARPSRPVPRPTPRALPVIDPDTFPSAGQLPQGMRYDGTSTTVQPTTALMDPATAPPASGMSCRNGAVRAPRPVDAWDAAAWPPSDTLRVLHLTATDYPADQGVVAYAQAVNGDGGCAWDGYTRTERPWPGAPGDHAYLAQVTKQHAGGTFGGYIAVVVHGDRVYSARSLSFHPESSRAEVISALTIMVRNDSA